MGAYDLLLEEGVEQMVSEELRELLSAWGDVEPSPEEWFMLHRTAVRRVTERLAARAAERPLSAQTLV